MSTRSSPSSLLHERSQPGRHVPQRRPVPEASSASPTTTSSRSAGGRSAVPFDDRLPPAQDLLTASTHDLVVRAKLNPPRDDPDGRRHLHRHRRAADAAGARCLRSCSTRRSIVGDPVAVKFLALLNPSARSLHALYVSGKPRLHTYEDLLAEILSPLRAGRTVCAAFYRHPAVFVSPYQQAIERARQEGFQTFMLPGICPSTASVRPGVLPCRGRLPDLPRHRARPSAATSRHRGDAHPLPDQRDSHRRTACTSRTGRRCPCSSTTCRTSIQPGTR